MVSSFLESRVEEESSSHDDQGERSDNYILQQKIGSNMIDQGVEATDVVRVGGYEYKDDAGDAVTELQTKTEQLSIDSPGVQVDDVVDHDYDPDQPYHFIDDKGFFEVVNCRDLDNEKRLCDLGRVRSKALKHEAYSKAILQEENLHNNVKPAYRSARVKHIKYINKLLQKMTPKFLKKGDRFTYDNHEISNSSGSSSTYKRTGRCILGRPGGDVAHFIPRSPPCAMFYGPVVESALGTDKPAPSATVQQAMIHRVRGMGGRKIDHTGVKHNTLNKCQMSRQKQLYDKDPHFIIVPILDVAEVQDWTEKEGEDQSYHAVVLVGLDEQGEDWRGEVSETARIPCTEREVEKAINLLGAYTKALSLNLQSSDFTELSKIAPKKLKKEVQKRVDELETTRENLRQNGTPILKLVKRVNADTALKLIKVALKKTHETTVPDPFLLTVKAAVNWSCRCNVELLPVCGEEESSSESCSECGKSPRPKPVVPPKALVLNNTDPEMSDLDED